MRELLLLATILLGQLSPNCAIWSQLERNLLTYSQPPATKTAQSVVGAVPAAPIKLSNDNHIATALAVYSIDISSNEVLVSKDVDKRLPVASLTKLMTAYVILKSEPDLGKQYTVPMLRGQEGDASMGLIPGDTLTIRDLLAGLLINSGSDAAQTLAIGNAGGVDLFVSKMNQTATDLNFTNTHFTNPVGWDDTENYSSAKDMAELTRILLRSETFREIMGTRSKLVSTGTGRILQLSSTNQLLGTPGYLGVKTGFTNNANECLVSLYKNGKTEILTTVIGSSNRFGETESIKGWILDHFSW